MVKNDFNKKLIKYAEERNTRLIFNLDTTNALETLNEISDLIAAIKINRTLTDLKGLEIAKKIKHDVPIIADFKIADIPDTNKILAENAENAGFDAITVHAFIGRDAIKAVSDIIDTILVISMSHEGSKEFITKNITEFCKIAKELNIKTVVAPATRTKDIKLIRNILEEVIILSPGVGVQGAHPGDAIAAGADFEMIGRSLYNTNIKNKRDKAEKIKNKLKFYYS